MNKQDKKELTKAIKLINDAKAIVEKIKDLQQDRFENLSEEEQDEEKGERLLESAGSLDESLVALDETIDCINYATE